MSDKRIAGIPNDPVGDLTDSSPVLRVIPTQQRSREKVERILDVTAALIEEVGAGPITTAMIARRADLPIGSVYHYFPNRLAILTELARRATERVNARIEQLVTDVPSVDTWEEHLGNLIGAVLQAYRAEPGYVGLVRAMGATPELHEIAQQSTERMAGLVGTGPLLEMLDLPKARREIISQVLARTGQTLMEMALSQEEPEQTTRVITEMTAMFQRYLAPYLGGGAAQA